MSKIVIVTDSTADIPVNVRAEWGIRMVPLRVHFGSEAYLDAVTLQADEFYAKLRQASVMPTTSQPSPNDFLELYQELAQDPDVQIISIHLSSALSGTYQSAVLAKSLMEEKADISIIDSKSASMGCGLLAIRATEAAKQGKSKQEILQLIRELREQTGLYFLVDTLEFLQKGGRIGKAAALFGSLLNIKPILTVDAGGEVNSIDKVRGHKKAMARIIELLQQQFTPEQKVQAIFAHSDALPAAEEMGAQIKQHFNITSELYTTVGPVVGTHVGPGVVAVFLVPA